jgi:TPR repeat protein
LLLALVTGASATPSELEGACRAGDAAACLNVGRAAEEMGRDKDARDAYEAACQLKAYEGCAYAGALSLAADNVPAATKWFERGCVGGDLRSCAGRASRAYQAGDNEAAITWGTKVCPTPIEPCAADATCKEVTPKACRSVYAAADELQRFDVAYQVALTACRLGDRPMCKIAYDTPRTTDAQKFEVLEKGCEEAGDPALCNELGVQLSLGDIVAKDEARGHAYIVRACDAGDLNACASLSDTLLSDPRTEKDALPYLDRACAAGSQRSCKEAARVRGAPAEQARSAE